MRTFTFLFFTTACIFAPSSLFSQNAKIVVESDKTVSVEQIFDIILDQSGYKFIYSNDIVKGVPKVQLKKGTIGVKELLEQEMKLVDCSFEFTNNKTIIVKRKVPVDKNSLDSQRQTKVSGIVNDSDGQPLPGASIVEKGTKNGVQTDLDGNFIILVSDPNAVLIVSYLGFKTTEISLNGRANITVALIEDATGLDEVVIVAYGSVKKSDVTGAVSVIKSAEITAFPVPDVSQALKGRSAGVRVVQSSGQPGSNVQIQVRGGNSYLGDNDPLYVVDGFPITGGIEFLNPADIKSLNILKDASATAIYGSRGANGVVLISTHSLKKDIKDQINVSSYYGVQNVIGTYDLMNSRQFAELANVSATNEGIPLPFDLDNLPDIETDWQDEIFRPAAIQSHTISFSGSNEKSSYSASASYFNQKGIILNSGLKRGTLRIALDRKVNDWLKLDLSTVVTRTQTDEVDVNNGTGGDNIFAAALHAPPLISPYDDDGNYNAVDDFAFSPVLLNNPLLYTEIMDEEAYTSVLANMGLEFSFSDNLKFKVIVGTEQKHEERNYYSPSLLAKVTPTGFAETTTIRDISYQNQNLLTYNKEFSEKSKLSALAGFSIQTFEGRLNTSSAIGFANDVLGYSGLGSASTTFPNESYVEEWTILSWLARVNYNLNDKYLFTTSIRADGSSRFGENNKWGAFFSGAFAWRLNKENFLKDWDDLSNLKFRIGYGETGSTAISAYQSLNALGQATVTFGNSDSVGFAAVSAPNPDLKWETTGQLSLGLDAAFLFGKYRFTVDYYKKNTKDLLAIIPLPGSIGFDSFITNFGEIQNSGMEFSMGTTLTKGKFRWDMDGQISFNKNKVITVGQDILGGTLDIPFAQPVNIVREGEPLGMFYGFREDGYNDEGVIQFKDLSGNGTIGNEDQEILGSPYPDFIYGLNNTIRYGDFQLNIFIEGSQGNDLFWATGGYIANSFGLGGNQLEAVYQDYWTSENTGAEFAAPSENRAQFRASDRFIKDASYLRLKNIKLSYNLPVEKMKIAMKSLQFYVSAQNLFTITKYPGLDPEVSTRFASGDIRLGIDQTGYPSAKIFTLGLNLQL